QAQILDLMRDLRARLDMAMILITHDLGVIAETCDRVYVMYAGQFVEAAPVVELFCNPRHPYTQGLIAATPLLGEPERTLHTIPGAVPHLAAPLAGCAFAPRCAARVAHALTVCTEAAPALEQVAPGHWVRCWLDATREGG
ncbi:MAG: ABC transporter ATP-binding protein, partial [Anaerolineales bacterium]|nr:ABC transporter ATP-binding protein [Anaerolineales bacterium]